jgi:copper(I)-binding protein
MLFMRHLLTGLSIIGLLATLSFAVSAENILIEIEDVRINKSSSLDNSANAYMHIINFSEVQVISLDSVSSTAAKSITFRHAPSENITIEAGAALNMEPDNIHLRLEHLTHPITEGDIIPLRLTFSHGDTYLVDAVVVKPGTHIHQDTSGGSISHNNH